MFYALQFYRLDFNGFILINSGFMKQMLHGAVSVGTFVTCTLQEASGVEITVRNAAAVRF
jgi:hypothetical protein